MHADMDNWNDKGSCCWRNELLINLISRQSEKVLRNNDTCHSLLKVRDMVRRGRADAEAAIERRTVKGYYSRSV